MPSRLMDSVLTVGVVLICSCALPFDEDAVVLQEVQVGLDPGHAPELGIARDRVAGLQDEARRRRADVAQLDDLDGAGGIEAEARDLEGLGLLDGAVVVLVDRDFVVAELQHHLAADLDDGFVGEAQSLQGDAAGDLDVEDLSARRRGLAHRLLDGRDELNVVRASAPWLPASSAHVPAVNATLIPPAWKLRSR